MQPPGHAGIRCTPMLGALCLGLGLVAAPPAGRLAQEPQTPVPAVEEHVTVVATTRTGRRIDDEPTRVEVLEREEIEEKMLMTPGDIVMLLNEMGGLRVQATSLSLGAAAVRIQGMRGRYTRLLADGLPLLGEVRGLGLLQVPPMDLGQVEVIKGVASALYGAGAMGGVVNVLSRRPGAEATRELLLNRSTRGGTDAVAFLSGPVGAGWSGSMLVGGHWQEPADVDKDGWADLASYNRVVVRPRVFWEDGKGRSLFATVGVGAEDRTGGTMTGRVLAGSGQPHREALETRRWDTGIVGQVLVGGRAIVTARAALARQRHQHEYGTVVERDRHDTAFGEIAVRLPAGRHTWIAGLAVEHDRYAARDRARVSHAFTVPGVFVQHDVDLTSALSLSSSGRVDVHSRYGTFFSPRLSALVRAGRWSSRLSVGGGFVGPSAVTEETEAAGVTSLVIEDPLVAERGVSASIDLSRTDGPVFYAATLFASRIHNPVYVERSPRYVLRNLDRPATNAGLELLGRIRQEPFTVTASYTYVRARETVGAMPQDVALTPRHSVGIVGMWEVEGRGRVGLEWYYTGRQRLDENPYRAVSRPYAVVGVLAERAFGRLRLFINGENLTGVRQTEWDSLVRPERAADGRWTVDGWAPVDGRNINGGIRLGF
jgi:outer membrane receptor for ferrienterochelin and colicins